MPFCEGRVPHPPALLLVNGDLESPTSSELIWYRPVGWVIQFDQYKYDGGRVSVTEPQKTSLLFHLCCTNWVLEQW